MKKTLLVITMMALMIVPNFADEIGSAAVNEEQEYTLEEMFEYAYQDEIMAKEEYNYIIDTFDVTRPFTNIIKAEERHITYVEDLYEAYDMEIPTFEGTEHLVLPTSVTEAFELGVVAEIKNIEMYEQFLAQDLPEDVRETFEFLKTSSESHLKAFTRNSDTSSNASGNSNGRGNRNGRR